MDAIENSNKYNRSFKGHDACRSPASLLLESIKPPFFNPGDPLNHEAGEQYFRSHKSFQKKAEKWTEKYAMD